jgi:hypothetical protein
MIFDGHNVQVIEKVWWAAGDSNSGPAD